MRRSGKPGKIFTDEALSGDTDGGCRDSGRVGVNGMVRNSSKDVLYPANERKPDPRLIVDALENASEMVDIQGLLDVEDLLRAYEVDQEDLEMRARETDRKLRGGNTRSGFLFSFGFDG